MIAAKIETDLACVSPQLKSWVQRALDHSGKGQAELAREVEKRIGRSFDRSMVNKMVGKASRQVKADEMLAISEITGYPIDPSQTHMVDGMAGSSSPFRSTADCALANPPPPGGRTSATGDLGQPSTKPDIRFAVHGGLAQIVATVDRKGLAKLRATIDLIEQALED